EKKTLPVIAPVPVSTTTAPRPVPDATGGGLDPPPLPPPQEIMIPAARADRAKPIETFRKFIMGSLLCPVSPTDLVTERYWRWTRAAKTGDFPVNAALPGIFHRHDGRSY